MEAVWLNAKCWQNNKCKVVIGSNKHFCAWFTCIFVDSTTSIISIDANWSHARAVKLGLIRTDSDFQILIIIVSKSLII